METKGLQKSKKPCLGTQKRLISLGYESYRNIAMMENHSKSMEEVGVQWYPPRPSPDVPFWKIYGFISIKVITFNDWELNLKHWKKRLALKS